MHSSYSWQEPYEIGIIILRIHRLKLCEVKMIKVTKLIYSKVSFQTHSKNSGSVLYITLHSG